MTDTVDGHSETLERVRLHISPFNAELLDKIIPPVLQALTSGTSFHNVQTFPERGFGFVELPVMEADKLKKKLNGSTLRGTKVRIEDAKPESRVRASVSEEATEATASRPRKDRSKKRKDETVISGHELEDGRRVKRGWKDGSTSARESKKRRKSSDQAKADDGDLKGKKMRFRTTVPSSTAQGTDEATGIEGGKEERKLRKSRRDPVVVEEYSKTSKLQLKAAQDAVTDRSALTYDDELGWVDGAGNAVEKPSRSSRRKANKTDQPIQRKTSAVESTEVIDTPMEQDSIETSQLPEEAEPLDTTAESQTTTAEPFKEVHPLKALFKRPALRSDDKTQKPRPQPIDTSFSFFDPSAAQDGDGDEEMMDGDLPPQTPHTKRDLEWRNIRSAAPTPDTAAIGRHFSFPFAGSDEEDEEQAAEADTDVDAIKDAAPNAMHIGEDAGTPSNAVENGRGEESAFRKWFYENRGDLNRSWKKRRRDEKKIVRQRENRKLSNKVA